MRISLREIEFCSLLISFQISHSVFLFLSDFFSVVIIFDYYAQWFDSSNTWTKKIDLERLCSMITLILRVDLLFRLSICLHVSEFSVYASECYLKSSSFNVFRLLNSMLNLQCFELHFDCLWKFTHDQCLVTL